MSSELQHLLLTRTVPPAKHQRMFGEIHRTMLSNSRHMDGANFRSFHPDDLKHMVLLYDRHFLDGACVRALGERRLNFQLSQRMTRSGGRTMWKTLIDPAAGTVREEFEIAVSSHLLFQTFRDDHSPVLVTGLPCENRLQAMQRIVEHELVHLAERLAWNTSNCRATRFQSIARRLFGHQAHTHQLVTTAEVARRNLGIRRGSRVAFHFEGRRYQGVVNRITKRVTVLVADSTGMLYSDGNRYRKFYIPLSMLENQD